MSGLQAKTMGLCTIVFAALVGMMLATSPAFARKPIRINVQFK